MSPEIDVIVVNYRTPNYLSHFVHSLLKHAPTHTWSFALANVSPTAEDVYAADHLMGLIPGSPAYHEWDENVGYATAVNRAARDGNGEVIAIFNSDTRLTECLLDRCYEALVANDSWAVLGPRQIDDQCRITAGGIFGTLEHRQDRGFHHRNNDTLYGDIRDDAVSVAGSAYFIKRSVWEELTECPVYQTFTHAEGAFLPTRHYYEETFCSYHAIAHGYRCVYFGPAVMIHQWHKSSSVGGRVEKVLLPDARALFRDACQAHGIPHD